MATPAISEREALARATEAFRGTAFEATQGYTPAKVLERATVVSFEGGRLVFEIERHRRILGASYTPGHGMSAFETYWPRFTFDLNTNELEELPEFTRRTSELEVNAYAIAVELAQDHSFSFERDEEGHCVAKEATTVSEKVVESEADVAAFAEDIYSVDGIRRYLTTGSELQGEDLRDLPKRIYEHLSGELRDKALSSWRMFGCDEDTW